MEALGSADSDEGPLGLVSVAVVLGKRTEASAPAIAAQEAETHGIQIE